MTTKSSSFMCFLVVLKVGAACAADEQDTSKREPKVAIDLELGYRMTQVDFDADTKGQWDLGSWLLPPDGRKEFDADGFGVNTRVHFPVELIRGSVFVQFGGVWNPDANKWGDVVLSEEYLQVPKGDFIEGTRLSADGSAAVGAGLRWEFSVGAVEIGVRPYAGLIWDFYDIEVRSDWQKLAGLAFGLALPSSHRNNNFVVTSAMFGSDIELAPFPHRRSLYLYFGGGYEIPFANENSSAGEALVDISAPILLFDRDPSKVRGDVTIQSSWFIQAGIGWRFDTPF